MKKILITLCVLLLGTSLAGADFMDGNVARRPNRVNPFVSQEMIKPPKGKTPRQNRPYITQPLPYQEVQPRTEKIRPGRDHDNPAAHRFGDGSQPNKHIWERNKQK